MGQARDIAQLGWKTCDAKKRDAPNALRDADDVKKAWKAHEGLLRSTRRTRAVYMEIIDMHDDPEVDCECALPPNTLNLDRLREKTRSRRMRKERPTPATEVHVHQHYDNDRVPAKRGHGKVAADSDSDSKDEPSSIPIRQVLADLHEKMPDLEIIQYEDVLRSKKIVYAQTVVDFDREYYVNTIGMADGVVGPFLRHARKLVQKERKIRKRARVDGNKENEPVIN
ncbi:hypothetical protein B0H19DRAFT_1088437 [Mycena capillaripes]|nr:hypothetical protein B0H19DRAFT_1088437 [Mycena capillaripes]